MPRTALLIALVTGAIFLLTVGNWLIYANDEGLYLDGGVRVFDGQVPYRDFFAITGPGTFWLLAALFRIFGVSLRTARLLRALDLAAMTGLTYWIARRMGSRFMAFIAAVAFAALAVGIPNGLVVNHRWESNAFALAAIAATIRLMERPGWRPAAAAGGLAILGAWCTPSAWLVALVTGGWILCQKTARRFWPAFAFGAAATGLIPAAALTAQGALRPMIQSMFWIRARYPLANRLVYGAVPDNPLRLIAAAHGFQILTTALFVLATCLPAILPLLVAIAWLPEAWKLRGKETFLLLSGAALVASLLPRWDLMHLLFISPVFVILAAVWFERHARGILAAATGIAVLIPVLIMAAANLFGHTSRETVSTPVGTLEASPADARQLRLALAVPPGGTLFVFPYQAMFYFLTGARNPTEYSFLQPGMMGPEDDRRAASQLRARPPEWVLYGDLPPAYFLRIWPSSNPASLRMPAVEDFIRNRYAPPPGSSDAAVEYRLLRLRKGL